MRPREVVDGLGPHSLGADVEPLLDHRETDESHVLALLRKRRIAPAVIEAVARHDRWNKRHVIRAAIVGHQKTPRTLALRMLPNLFWAELLRVANNPVLAMPVRVAAESRLRERLPELELGERISMAFRAPRGLLPNLAAENDARVVRSLLRNPWLREQDVLLILRREDASPESLRAVASAEPWICRPPVTVGVISHPNTPVHVALKLLARVNLRTLERLLSKDELPNVVAIGARRRLEEQNAPSSH